VVSRARRFTVMGFTEAELGFVLAAAFAAFAVSGVVAEESATAAVAERDTLRQRYDSVASELAALRDSVKKRSTKVPRCWEKGIRPDTVAIVEILGRDSYRIDGDRLTLASLRERFQGKIDTARVLQCRFFIRVRAVRGVDATTYDETRGALSRYFDVGR
jgi:hypothetical protein